jgi:succinoglycan biosynthesis transport protein ExoP
MHKPPYLLEGESHQSVLTISDMVGFLKRRKKGILVTTGVIFVACLVWCAVGTKHYVATGKIQIQKEQTDDFGLEGSISGANNSVSDALDYNVTLETQANILQSETLALQVARELNLEKSDDFTGANRWLHIPAWMKPWEAKGEPANVPLADAPVRRYRVLKEFDEHLKVETVSGTRLITVKYTSSDPRMAANVVNTLMRDYENYTFQERYTVTAQASTWLSSQLSDLKTQTQELEAKSMEMRRGTGNFGTGSSDDHNIVLAKLETLNAQVSAAEADRILKEAVYHSVQNLGPEQISNLAGTSSSPVPPNALALVQALHLQEASLQSQLQEEQAHYGADYPKLAETQAQLDGVRSSLKAEVERISERAKSDYEIATETANKAKQNFDAQKGLALDTNDKSIQFALAQQEADDSRNLYADLLKKLKEAGVLQGLKSTNIAVIDAAGVPVRPKMPYAPVDLPIAIAVGLALGILLAVFIDLTDKEVRNVEDVESITRAPVLAVLPAYALRSGEAPPKRITLFPNLLGRGDAVLPIAAVRPDSAYVESVRGLRTSMLYACDQKMPQVIKVSSPLEGEGKSTLVMNLGTILARQGARVLLVDADFRSRNRQLNAMVGASQKDGLSTLLLDAHKVPSFQSVEAIPGLYLMPAGPVPESPAELLSSKRMKELMQMWREEFDYVLLDSAPILPVSDSMVLNQYTDYHLLVARYDSTPKAAFMRSYQAVTQQAPQGSVGVVVNAFSQNSQEFENYYGYKGYPYRTLSRRTDYEQVA